MAEWTHSASWQVRSLNLQRGVGTLPNPAQFRLLLFNGTTLTQTMTKGEMLAAELRQENGYSRQAYAPTNAVYDSPSQRAELGRVVANFVGSGGVLQWDAAALWADCSATASKPISSIDLAANQLTLVAHGLTTGAEVIVTADDGVAGGLEAGLIYYAKVIDPSTIELCSDAAMTNTVNITSAGGEHWLGYAAGEPVFFANFPGSNIIGDGVPESLRIDWTT